MYSPLAKDYDFPVYALAVLYGFIHDKQIIDRQWGYLRLIVQTVAVSGLPLGGYDRHGAKVVIRLLVWTREIDTT
jgi:hypothetical protein